jgi:hypothetical protein
MGWISHEEAMDRVIVFTRNVLHKLPVLMLKAYANRKGENRHGLTDAIFMHYGPSCIWHGMGTVVAPQFRQVVNALTRPRPCRVSLDLICVDRATSR